MFFTYKINIVQTLKYISKFRKSLLEWHLRKLEIAFPAFVGKNVLLKLLIFAVN